MKKIILYIIIAAELFLCSCGRLYSALGIDKKDYSKEAVTATIMDDDQLIARLAQSACIVCFGDSIITFDSFRDRADAYVDVVLNYLAGTFYSRYSADRAMMDKFSREYPELHVNALIPVKDYENTVYTYFGGTRKATVRSTAMYTYLDRIDAFILVGRAPDITADCTVHEAEETENTYRLTVTFTKNNVSAGTYDVIFRKRGDGDPYIWRLSASSKKYGTDG